MANIPVWLATVKEVYDDVKTRLDTKVSKVSGKGLSTNDYTNTAKAKVDAIPANPKYTDTQLTELDILNMGFSKGGTDGIKEIPQASNAVLGGVKGGPATSYDTLPVHVTGDGYLRADAYTKAQVDGKVSTINENLSKAITAPQTASVGQILAVKAVDGSGKPTQWKVVDMPTGGDSEHTYTLGIDPNDGLLYVYVDGQKQGTGIELAQAIQMGILIGVDGTVTSKSGIFVDNGVAKLNDAVITDGIVQIGA